MHEIEIMLNYKLTILIVIRYTIANQNSCINIYAKSIVVFHSVIILNINIIFVIFEYTLSKFYLGLNFTCQAPRFKF